VPKSIKESGHIGWWVARGGVSWLEKVRGWNVLDEIS